MRRRRRVIRFITRTMATALIGAFAGFLVPTVIADLTPKPAVVETAVPESPVARTFINASPPMTKRCSRPWASRRT